MSRSMVLRCASALLAFAAMASTAHAQVQRNFPQNALRGEIAFATPPAITLNRVAAQLAPGARIRGLDNMLVMSGTLVGQRAVVNYTLEPGTGLVKDVWILRSDEAARRPWPTTPEQAASWSFDPVAQVWTRP